MIINLLHKYPANRVFAFLLKSAMKKLKLFLILSAFVITGFNAFAQTYVKEKTIALPGNSGYDYVFIDQVNHVLYASHGTSVNVVDLQTATVTGTISGMKGVHGIAISNELNRGFISDGKATSVVAFDIKTLQIIKTIPVSGKGPDGIIFDPFSKKILAFEGDSNLAVIVDPQTLEQTGSIDLGGGPEFAVSDGEGLIYNNLEDKSSLDVIDAATMKVIKNYPLTPCGGPTGVALDKADSRVFTVCRENKGMSVVKATTGKVIKTLSIGTGVDAVVYDPETKLIIASNGDGTASKYLNKTDQTTTRQFKH